VVALAALVPAATAGAQAPQRQTASVLFSQTQPGKSSGLRILIDYRNPTDPAAKPFAVRRIVTTLAPGSLIDTSVPAKCTLSDAALMANGTRDCPVPSIVGSAAFTYFDGVAQTLAAPSPCVDTAPPTVSIRGLPRSCVRGALRTRVRIGDTSTLRGVLVRLNGRRVKSTKRKSFAVRVRRSKLRKGRNRLTVVAVDRRGNRFTLGRRFLRCR
jgi:hypothetical protein